jgi:hypothetical protein
MKNSWLENEVIQIENERNKKTREFPNFKVFIMIFIMIFFGTGYCNAGSIEFDCPTCRDHIRIEMNFQPPEAGFNGVSWVCICGRENEMSNDFCSKCHKLNPSVRYTDDKPKKEPGYWPSR